MKWLVSLTLAGSVLGGVYPGSIIAFLLTADLGSEIVCFILNVLLGIAGAFVGMLVAKEIQTSMTFRRSHVIFPLILGLLCGIVGYFFADWAISHADPPL